MAVKGRERERERQADRESHNSTAVVPYLIPVPHMESSLVAMRQHRLPVGTEDSTEEAKVTSADFTDPHLCQHSNELVYQLTVGWCLTAQIGYTVPRMYDIYHVERGQTQSNTINWTKKYTNKWPMWKHSLLQSEFNVFNQRAAALPKLANKEHGSRN